MSNGASKPLSSRSASIARVLNIREEELSAALWAALYFFALLATNYVLRPLRETMGVKDLEKLPWMYTGTLLGTLVANPLYAMLVRRFPRRKFIPFVHRFFELNLLLFFAALWLLPPAAQKSLPAAFFIWVSVYNFFIVSVFWGFLVDLFSNEQARRLFPFIGAGGTLGAIAGSALTTSIVRTIGPINLLLVCIALLEVAVFCVGRLAHRFQLPKTHADVSDAPTPGSAADLEAPIRPAAAAAPSVAWYSGFQRTVRSPYLLGICGFLLLMSVTATFFYFEQGRIVKAEIHDDKARTAFFAQIDLNVNVLTLLTQTMLSGRLISWLGVGVTLLALPAISAAGFWALAATPSLALLMLVQTTRRAADYAIARPAREVLFTVVPRSEKYVAKNFIDTFVYRLGDQIGAWTSEAMKSLSAHAGYFNVVILALTGAWGAICLVLGRSQSRRALHTQTINAPGNIAASR